MKEFKGTKEEWKISTDKWGCVELGNNAIIACYSKSGNKGYNEDDILEANANAKLIASAPCLLEALQYIINDIKPEDACRGKFESFEKSKAYVGSKRLPTDEAILRCIEAIKKATE